MIHILDELRVRPGRLGDCDRAYRDLYFPLARRRGMTLEQAWTTPPFEMPDQSSTLMFVWSVPDPPAWWKMRYGAFDPAVTGFWRDLEPLLVDRRRVFLGPTPHAEAQP